MKILHTADLHLGAPMRTHLPPREAKLRRDELMSVFSRLLQLARAEGCAAVIIAGDLFDNEAAASLLSSTVTNAIEEYGEIDFYYASGNHEGDGWIPSAPLKNLHIFGSAPSYFQKENVTFFGQSNAKKIDYDNIYLQKERINIMILHGAMDTEIKISDLCNKQIDYCALGHYHAYAEKRIDARGIAVYAGCPAGRGFDELGEKGAVLIETGRDRLTHRFIPLSGRVLHRMEADISYARDLLHLFSICEAAASAAHAEDLVRLVLTGQRKSLPAPDTEAIRRHLGDRFYYLEVEDASTAAPDVTTLARERTLCGEFVRTVLAEASLEDEEKMRILSLGLSALGAEENGGAIWS